MKITPSNIADFIFCPVKYQLSKKRPKIITSKSPEAALGSALHDAIHRYLYQIVNDSVRAKKMRRTRAQKGETTEYFYKTLSGFLKFCAGLISEYLKGEKSTNPKIKDKRPINWPNGASPEEIVALKDHLLVLGLWMAKNYYLANQNKPAPFLREKLFSHSLGGKIDTGLKLVGKIDQARHNSKGEVFIVDLKTGFDPFEKILGINNHLGSARLYIDYQLSAYWWLWQQYFGKPPHKVGLYYLKTGKIYLTTRTESQITDLMKMIQWIIQTGREGNFIPQGMYYNRCRYCDYSPVCPYAQKLSPFNALTIGEIEESLPSKQIILPQIEEDLRLIGYKRFRLKLTRSQK